MHKKLFACLSFLLTLWVASFVSQLAFGDPPAKKQNQSDTKNGGIVTLYTLDPIANTFSFKDGQYGGVIYNHKLYNRGTDIGFGCYGKGSFTIAMEGGSLGKIVDLGAADDLQKMYGYREHEGKGHGFASIHKKGGKILILKKDKNTGNSAGGGGGGAGVGTGGKDLIPKEDNDASFQPIKETDELFGEGESRASAPVKLGHIYLLRLTDENDKKFERVVKLLVISYKENESVTIRWEVLE